MSADMAATPNNFDAHLSSVGDTPTTGSDDGAQSFNDSTGPSNTNALAEDKPAYDPNHVNPEQRARGDAQDESQEADFADIPDAPPDEPEAQPEEGEGEQEPRQEGMPSYEDLQGMYQALQGAELHEGLYDKLIPVTVNGVQVHKPISEVKEGYMRMSDYSRGKQEAAAQTKAAQQAVENNRMFLQRMADPKILRATLRRLGPQHEQAFHAAAEEYAAEFLQLKKMSPTERAAYERAQAAERKAEQLEEQMRRQPQQKPPDPAEQNRPQIEAVLNTSMAQSWQRHGIRPSPLANELFQRHVQAVWDTQLDTLAQAVEHASQATAEDLAHLAQQHLGQQQQAPRPRQAPQALPPRRMPAGAPPRPAPGQRQGARVSDFADFLKGR